MSSKRLIFDLTPEELREHFTSLKLPKYTAKQVLSWLYVKHIFDPLLFSNISKDNRVILKDNFNFKLPSLIKEMTDAEDGTVKYLLELDSGRRVETVLMDSMDHKTQCISTQDGCTLGCKFCLTGEYGFKGNLSAGGIVSQVMTAVKQTGEKPKNLVFMGMGEPMLNIDNVIRSLSILSCEDGLAYGMRRMILSTVGILEPLKKLLNVFPKIGIALSLNGVGGKRELLMPVEKTNPIQYIIDFYKTHREYRRPTFEYVVIKDVNSTEADAKELLRFTSQIRCKINLIPYNENPHVQYKSPSEEELNSFIKVLLKGNNAVTVRRSKGRNISGACGQLAGEDDA